MKFVDGAPLFAAVIGSGNDYGISAEREMEQKRRYYFAAWTLVIWDVDLQADGVVRMYTSATGTGMPTSVYVRGGNCRRRASRSWLDYDRWQNV